MELHSLFPEVNCIVVASNSGNAIAMTFKSSLQRLIFGGGFSFASKFFLVSSLCFLSVKSEKIRLNSYDLIALFSFKG